MLATHEPACGEVHSRLKAVITSMQADSSEAHIREQRLLAQLGKAQAEVEVIRAQRNRLAGGAPGANPSSLPRPSRSNLKGEREKAQRRSASPPLRRSASRKRDAPVDLTGSDDEDERRARMRRVGFGRDPLLPAGGPANGPDARARALARDARDRADFLLDRLHLNFQAPPPPRLAGAPPPQPPPPAARFAPDAEQERAVRDAFRRGGGAFAPFGAPGLPFGGGPPPPPPGYGHPPRKPDTPPPKKPDGPPPRRKDP